MSAPRWSFYLDISRQNFTYIYHTHTRRTSPPDVMLLFLVSHRNRRSERQRFTMRVGKMAMHLISIPESPDPNPTFHTFRSLSRAN